MSSIYKKGRDGYFYYQAYIFNPKSNRKDKRVFHSLGTKDRDIAEVKKKKLDSIKFENKIGFIKIDVEGHELEVIEGALKTIKENKPVLLIEIEEKHSKRMVIDSIKYIKNIGYKCYFEKNKELLQVEKLKNVNEEFNFFFLPNIAK